ncbi:ATP-binding protein [Streptomyces atriruber]|uniref:ATP-binding protein n=1 Tax=Streptomyces atriruber TaxID=545121 RepID=UPI0007C69531|nr:hypothetical protein [Streptomyces atriruber]
MTAREPGKDNEVVRVGNLPGRWTGLVGRRSELADMQRLFHGERLVTLTGVAGVGKSRLALEAAVELQPSFRDGAWWVELSPLSQGSVLDLTIAEALPLADMSNRPMIDVLADYMFGQELLLVLDTCEHLADACALTAQKLLDAAPGLRILATSRRPLGVPVERVLTVDPMPVPDPDDPEAAGNDAMVLLAERASAVVPGFAVTKDNQPDMVRLCRRLEGLPLAIELAAARLRELSPAELATGLDDRLAVLETKEAAYTVLPPWHQALRTAIGWSNELCTPQQRLLWARTSVFAGTFEVEAVRRVCADDLLPDKAIPALLSALADASILSWVPTGGSDRYRMLDTIREYGAHWLRGLGEEDALRRRHLDHYLDLARRGDAVWIGPDQFAWFDRMTAERDNIRTAMEYSLVEAEGHTEHHTALDLAGALWFFWYACGFLKEGRLYLDRALAADTAPSWARAKALYANGQSLFLLGDLPALEECAAEGTALAARLGDTEGRYTALNGLRLATLHGDPDRVVTLAEDMLATDWREKPLTYPPLAALVIGAHAYATTGRPEKAIVWLDEVSVVCARHGESFMRAWGDTVHAMAELARGRYRAAQEHARAAVRVNRRMRADVGTGIALEALARAVAATGQYPDAAWLLGLTTHLWKTLGQPQAGVPTVVAARQVCEQQTRTALGDNAYQRAFDAGYTIDLNTGITHALAATPPHHGPSAS